MKKNNIGKTVAAVFIASMFLVSSTMVVNAGTKYGRIETIDEKEIDDKTEISEQEPPLYNAYEDELDDVKPNIDANNHTSSGLEFDAQNLPLQFNVKPSPKKYAVIMVGRYFGWLYLDPENWGYPYWPNLHTIQQYYTWYLNDAGCMYTTLRDAYGYEEENIFLLVKLLPDNIYVPTNQTDSGYYHFFEVPNSFDTSWRRFDSDESVLEDILCTFRPGKENALNEDDSLFICFIDHGATEKWLSPDYRIDNDWVDEEDAYDEDISTCAVFEEDQNGDSDSLILTMNKSVTIKGFRIRAKKAWCHKELRLKFYKGNTLKFTSIHYNWPNKKWLEVDFDGSEYEVDKVKVVFSEDAPVFGFSVYPAKVYEFDFQPADDIGNTFFGCPFLEISEFLQYLISLLGLGYGSDTQRLYDCELANYVDGITTKAKIIFALQPCSSGGFIDDLSGENRIICTASRNNETAFAGWIGPFRRALSKEDYADYDGDGNISILEAYRYAAEYVESQSPPEPQHPLIDDNGDGIGHYLNEPGYDPSTPGEDGYLANSTYLGVVNYPPSEPSKPDCDTWGGYQGIEYTFESDTTDPEEDEIYYLFDWGDDTDSIWLGPYTSGATVEASHIWTENGTYYVRVKAKDMVFNEHESLWSEPFKMKIGEDEDQPASSSEYTQNEMAESEYNLPLH